MMSMNIKRFELQLNVEPKRRLDTIRKYLSPVNVTFSRILKTKIVIDWTVNIKKILKVREYILRKRQRLTMKKKD